MPPGTKIDLFSQWRPKLHFQPPHGWMNDPCGFCSLPETGCYHLFFQWNPADDEWGNISWGSASSPDLLNWTTFAEPSLTPNASYDKEGIFTGCVLSVGGSGSLLAIYTSVSRLPIGYQLDYVYGSETLSIAMSNDMGKTFERIDDNPILPGPPKGLDVTGWRDPAVFAWPAMDRLLGTSNGLFGCISGGLKSEPVKGPTIFLYSIDPQNLKSWKYLGSLLDIKQHTTLSRWSGDLGSNFEVSNAFTVPSGDASVADMDIVICSAEGQKDGTSRAVYWLSGTLVVKGGVPKMEYQYGGFLDNGNFYAGNSGQDPKSGDRILWGWVDEELPLALKKRQGWSGMLSLPRTVEMQVLKGVTKARVSRLEELTSFRITKEVEMTEGTSTFTVSTISCTPIRSLKKLRTSAEHSEMTANAFGKAPDFLHLETSQWELKSLFKVGLECKRVGVVIHFSANHFVEFYFVPSREEFILDRSNGPEPDEGSSSNITICPHTLFSRFDSQTGNEVEERLCIRAWFDTSVLEVFVNDRTAVTQRIYPSEIDEGTTKLGFILDDESGETVLDRVCLWDKLAPNFSSES